MGAPTIYYRYDAYVRQKKKLDEIFSTYAAPVVGSSSSGGGVGGSRSGGSGSGSGSGGGSSSRRVAAVVVAVGPPPPYTSTYLTGTTRISRASSRGPRCSR